jgi:acyl-CoA reductase-like NAD-dependent aldehyde dehydrogenase/gamma-glutamyl-gamma-aminobutyrate hydrolase PuuD
MKKRIGISFSTTNFQFYWDWFTTEDLGDDIELVELSFEKNNVEDFASCDGFILTGGVDVHPSFYDQPEEYANRPEVFQPERDAFEKRIFHYSQFHSAPLLAICRGLQLVNVLLGGKLIQDLGKGNMVHRKETGNDKKHTAEIVAGSLLYQISGSSSSEINSAHHQAVDNYAIGENLMVGAWSKSDAVIEALEFKNKSGKAFMLGVQWHPERMMGKENHPLSKNIKDAFLNEVRNSNMKKLSVINPATGELIASLNVDTKEAVSQKLEVLRTGQQVWQETSLRERISVLQKFAELLEENKEKLAAVLTSEMGKPLQQSRNEIAGACTRIAWLTGNAEKYLSEEVVTDEKGLKEKIVYEPLGVICNISAWNYPYLVGVNVFIPALLGGNAVFYKPSEYATLTGLQIEKFLKEAGLPDDVFQVAIGKGDVGEALLELPLDGYFFTGSYTTGKYIYEKVAQKMVPCQCELGGKDPLYVADDVADIKAVAAATADGAFYNNGQSCCAVERIYVHQKVYDQYLAEFTEEVRSYKMGLPTGEGVYIGPLSRKEQLKVLKQQIEDATSKGATIITGGDRAGERGNFFQPTVLTNVNHAMSVMKEETFGPLIGVMKVADDEEAIALMQDTEYGLTASVYSSDQNRAETILGQLDTGSGYWNCCDRVSAALPWSGRKHSGFGATLSHAGLRAFVKPKAYHLRG